MMTHYTYLYLFLLTVLWTLLFSHCRASAVTVW